MGRAGAPGRPAPPGVGREGGAARGGVGAGVRGRPGVDPAEAEDRVHLAAADGEVGAELGAELQLAGVVAAAGQVGDAEVHVVETGQEVALDGGRALRNGPAAADAAAVHLGAGSAARADLVVLALEADVVHGRRPVDERAAGVPGDVVHVHGGVVVVRERDGHAAEHLEPDRLLRRRRGEHPDGLLRGERGGREDEGGDEQTATHKGLLGRGWGQTKNRAATGSSCGWRMRACAKIRPRVRFAAGMAFTVRASPSKKASSSLPSASRMR